MIFFIPNLANIINNVTFGASNASSMITPPPFQSLSNPSLNYWQPISSSWSECQRTEKICPEKRWRLTIKSTFPDNDERMIDLNTYDSRIVAFASFFYGNIWNGAVSWTWEPEKAYNVDILSADDVFPFCYKFTLSQFITFLCAKREPDYQRTFHFTDEQKDFSRLKMFCCNWSRRLIPFQDKLWQTPVHWGRVKLSQFLNISQFDRYWHIIGWWWVTH